MIGITRPARPSPFAVFRHRSFAWLWIAQFISTVGSQFALVAAAVLAYRLTGSALSVGLLLIATALPSLLVGLLAGVVVDRGNRKAILIAADLIRAALALLLPLALPFGIGWLYVIVLLSNTATQFFDPAQASVLPELASEDELASANTLMEISITGAGLIGYTLGGLLVVILPIEWAFALDGLSFLVSAACIGLVRVAPLAAAGQHATSEVLNDLRTGLRALAETPILRALLVVVAPTAAAVGLCNALLLPFALQALQATELTYGVMSGMEAIGFLIANLLLAYHAERLHPTRWIVLSLLLMAICDIGLVLTASLPLAIVLVGLGGAFNAPFILGRTLLIQRNTPRELLGRVSSAYFVARSVCYVAGMAAVGLADLFSTRAMVLADGLLFLTAGLLALWLLRPGLPILGLRRAPQAVVLPDEALA
jgi:MFS family permease